MLPCPSAAHSKSLGETVRLQSRKLKLSQDIAAPTYPHKTLADPRNLCAQELRAQQSPFLNLSHPVFPLRLPGPSQKTVATLLPKAKKEKTHCRTAKVCSLRSHGTDRGANSTMLSLLRRSLPHTAEFQAEGIGTAQPSPALARASLLRPRPILPRGNLGIQRLGPEGRR